ncbi:MAG: glutamate--tRNA ligase, partial [Treponema sp.]|nr:glutamate--tRNA ligase [Treponema sp.]
GLFGGAPGPEETARYTAAMGLVRERANFLQDIPAKLGFLFSEPAVPAAEEFIPQKADLAQAASFLRTGRELLPSLAASGDGEAETLVKARAETAGVKPGDFLMPLRVAITGARVSPPLFGSIRLLGAERCLARIDAALKALEGAGRQNPEGGP